MHYAGSIRETYWIRGLNYVLEQYTKTEENLYTRECLRSIASVLELSLGVGVEVKSVNVACKANTLLEELQLSCAG